MIVACGTGVNRRTRTGRDVRLKGLAMSSLEGNKIAAAVLVGGMITLTVGIATDFIYRPHHDAQAAHEGGEPAAPTKPAPVEPVLGLIAAANVENGQKVAAKCQSCHDFTAANANKVGPGLYGVIGRVSGTHEGFNYSAPMKAHGKPWTYAAISHLITNPKAYIPGTKMTFPGLPKVQDRADLLAWLRNQAASPAPLPTPEEIAAEDAAFKQEQEAATAPAGAEAAVEAESAPVEGAAAPAEGGAAAPAETAPAEASAVALIATADPAAGQKVSAKCKACHDFAKDGKNKVGPHLWGIVGGTHAHVADFPYSDAMKGMAGKPWTYEDFDKFLENPKGYVPGTKMSFPGLKKPEERAAMIRWLRDQADSPAPLPQ
jgi:cytochrome c